MAVEKFLFIEDNVWGNMAVEKFLFIEDIVWGNMVIEKFLSLKISYEPTWLFRNSFH